MNYKKIGFSALLFIILSIISVSFAANEKYIDKTLNGPYIFIGQSESSFYPTVNFQPLVVTSSSVGYGAGYRYTIFPRIDTSIEIMRADHSSNVVANWYFMPISAKATYSFASLSDKDKFYFGVGYSDMINNLSYAKDLGAIWFGLKFGYEYLAWEDAISYEYGYNGSQSSIVIGYHWNK